MNAPTPAAPVQTVDFVSPIRRFHWFKLFRSVVYAIDPQLLVLAAVGLMLVAAGQWLLFGGASELADETAPAAIFRATAAPIWPWTEGAWHPAGLMGPWCTVVDAGLGYTQFLPFNVAARRLIFLLWTIVVWSVVGGTMCRIVALRFARDRYTSLVTSARYTVQRLPALLTPAALIAGGIGFFWVFAAFTGLVGRIPYVGPWLSAIFMVVPLVSGFIMAVLMVAFAVTWPVYHASIATEGSDGFEGFSRPLNLIASRPLYAFWTWLIAIFLSAVVLFVVGQVVSLIGDVTKWGFGSGAGSARADAVWNAGPDMFQ